MPEYTPNLNLYKPGGGSSGLIQPDEVADIDRLNGNFDLIDAFAGGWGDPAATVRSYRGPASQRSTIVPNPHLGDTYQETDGEFDFHRYDGASWRNRTPGKLLGLTSTTGTINGTVDITWASGVPAHHIDTGGYFDSSTADNRKEVLLKRIGWYSVTYTLRTTGTAPLTCEVHLNGTLLSYAGAGSFGTAGAASTASRTFLVKATAVTDKLKFRAISNAAVAGSHSVYVEYKGEL